ncbi:MAG: hypothetical protein GXP04_04095 [Alphaproteobacteria bacterium]|nr:hypothetical protein [Alphaproteobacteria bacterium]
MGGAHNTIILLTKDGEEAWPEMLKSQVASLLAERVAKALQGPVLVKAAE